MKIEYNRRASYTPAYGLLAEGWNELVQSGLVPEQTGLSPVAWDNEVFYAVSDEGDIVGVIAWAASQQSAVYEVKLAYVEPSSRRRGVFRALFDELAVRARKNNVVRIGSSVHAGNTVAKMAFEKAGGIPAAVVFEHDMFMS